MWIKMGFSLFFHLSLLLPADALAANFSPPASQRAMFFHAAPSEFISPF
jgi:hypothetical protein